MIDARRKANAELRIALRFIQDEGDTRRGFVAFNLEHSYVSLHHMYCDASAARGRIVLPEDANEWYFYGPERILSNNYNRLEVPSNLKRWFHDDKRCARISIPDLHLSQNRLAVLRATTGALPEQLTNLYESLEQVTIAQEDTALQLRLDAVASMAPCAWPRWYENAALGAGGFFSLTLRIKESKIEHYAQQTASFVRG